MWVPSQASLWGLAGLLLTTAASYLYSLRRQFQSLRRGTLQRLRAEAELAAARLKGPAEKGAPAASLPADLPRCVRLYLETALKDAPGDVSLYTCHEAGRMRLDPTDAWKPLIAVHYESPLVPTFLWTGRMTFAPLMPAEGYDGRVNGRGLLHWRLLGCIPVAAAEGPSLSRAALTRYLAEGVLFPHALLPSQHLRWEQCGDNEARATLTDGSTSVSATFTFNQDNQVVRVTSEDYLRMMPDGSIQRWPWICHCSDYRCLPLQRPAAGSKPDGAGDVAGSVWVPTQCQVAWGQPDGTEFCYIELELLSMTAE